MQLIVAADMEWGIGKDGNQPFFIKEDLARFKRMTTGGTIIMGRKTLEALPGGRPLPDRRNIVLTHDTGYKVAGAEVVHSVEELLETAPRDAWVVGGESVYRALLPFCDRAYCTMVRGVYGADRFFPDIHKNPEWVVLSITFPKNESTPDFWWVLYERTKGGRDHA